jgi:hypothetical protein
VCECGIVLPMSTLSFMRKAADIGQDKASASRNDDAAAAAASAAAAADDDDCDDEDDINSDGRMKELIIE